MAERRRQTYGIIEFWKWCAHTSSGLGYPTWVAVSGLGSTEFKGLLDQRISWLIDRQGNERHLQLNYFHPHGKSLNARIGSISIAPLDHDRKKSRRATTWRSVYMYRSDFRSLFPLSPWFDGWTSHFYKPPNHWQWESSRLELELPKLKL